MSNQETAASRKPGPPNVFSAVLLTPQQVAGRLQVSLSYLAKGRMSRYGPPFIKVGRAVRYSEAALEEWIKKQERQSTSQQ